MTFSLSRERDGVLSSWKKKFSVILFRKSREGEESLIEPDSTASYIPLYWSGKNSGLLSFVKSGLNPSPVMMNSRLLFLFCMKIFYMDR